MPRYWLCQVGMAWLGTKHPQPSCKTRRRTRWRTHVAAAARRPWFGSCHCDTCWSLNGFCMARPQVHQAVMEAIPQSRRRPDTVCCSCSSFRKHYAIILFAQVHEVATEAIARARRGDGPTLIEAQTYRFRGHSLADPDELRPKEEKEKWAVRPFSSSVAKSFLLSRGHMLEFTSFPNVTAWRKPGELRPKEEKKKWAVGC